MANTTAWKSPFSNQETLETKTFTWRLRPHLAQISTLQEESALSKNLKGVNLSGGSASRLSTAPGQSNSASVLKTSNSQHQQLEQHSNFLRFQEFEVEAGQSLGLHSMWSIFLVSCGSTIPGQRSNTNVTAAAASTALSPTCNSDFVGLFLRKLLKSSKVNQSGYVPSTRNDEVIVRYKIEIMDRDGEVLYTKNCETASRDKLDVGYWDWKKIVPVSKFQSSKAKTPGREFSTMESTDESLLLLRVSFTLANRRKTTTGDGKTFLSTVPSVEETSTRDAANAFLNLVSNSKSLQPDVVLEITNRRKFFVHKKVLSGRSPTFSKQLSDEKLSSVIKVDDVSANTMELILKHIYTGQLEEEWTTNPVTATELIYSSEKYGLPALKELCNKHLVRAATKKNCYRLMEVAQLHNLEKAAEDLMSYVSEGISSKSNSRKPSEESVDLHSQ